MQIDFIKLEDSIKAIADAGILAIGHIGLTPQSSSQLGGFRVQGKNLITAEKLLEDALALEEAGAFGIVLEAISNPVARVITQRLKIPTIGIGAAGPYCDAQVLVIHDLLGLFERFVPKFVKQYAQIGKDIVSALSQFDKEVKIEKFPDEEHSYHIEKEVEEEIIEHLKKMK